MPATLRHPLARPGRGCRLLCAALFVLTALPAVASPMLLRVQGQYTPSNAPASGAPLAQAINGASSWAAMGTVAMTLELRYDSQLSSTSFNPSLGTFTWSYDTVQALHLQLGNAQFRSTAADGASLGRIVLGPAAVAAPELKTGGYDGFLFSLSQPWSRSGTPPVYSFPGATPQTSADGRYDYYFRTLYDFSGTNRVLDFWALHAASDTLYSGLPTGRWGMTGFTVESIQDSPPPDPDPADPLPPTGVPEPGSLALAMLGLLLLSLRRSSQGS